MATGYQFSVFMRVSEHRVELDAADRLGAGLKLGVKFALVYIRLFRLYFCQSFLGIVWQKFVLIFRIYKRPKNRISAGRAPAGRTPCRKVVT